jgi:hypothetical protein
MVYRKRSGLGEPESAIKHFQALIPYACALRALQQKCAPDSPGYLAFDIALSGLEDAAFHFTRRRYFYELEHLPRYDRGAAAYPGLGSPEETTAAFKSLRPYREQLRWLQNLCQAFGHEYQALSIPIRCLDTAAFHFTKRDTFYAAPACGSHGRTPW